MGGFIAKGGRKGGNAGYYLHLDPQQSFLAGGNHMPSPERLKKIRMEIMYNIDEFKSILDHKGFKNTFGQIDGDKLSRPPKDFPADFPEIDLLKFKSYTAIHSFDNRNVTDKNFEVYTLKVFKDLYPLNKFLNRAFE
jgi:uncharacterized protein (TIGR02453 family)